MMSNDTKNITVIPSILFFKKFIYLIDGKLPYNFVLVSALQQHESIIIIYIYCR